MLHLHDLVKLFEQSLIEVYFKKYHRMPPELHRQQLWQPFVDMMTSMPPEIQKELAASVRH